MQQSHTAQKLWGAFVDLGAARSALVSAASMVHGLANADRSESALSPALLFGDGFFRNLVVVAN